MKIARRNAKGETKEMLLKEYFLNAYLIALLKRAGEETARLRRDKTVVEDLAEARARI